MTMEALFQAARAMDYINIARKEQLDVDTISVADIDTLKSAGLPVGIAIRLHRALGEKSRFFDTYR